MEEKTVGIDSVFGKRNMRDYREDAENHRITFKLDDLDGSVTSRGVTIESSKTGLFKKTTWSAHYTDYGFDFKTDVFKKVGIDRSGFETRIRIEGGEVRQDKLYCRIADNWSDTTMNYLKDAGLNFSKFGEDYSVSLDEAKKFTEKAKKEKNNWSSVPPSSRQSVEFIAENIRIIAAAENDIVEAAGVAEGARKLLVYPEVQKFLASVGENPAAAVKHLE